MKRFFGVLAVAALASTASAQAGGGMAGMNMDHTSSVKQVGPHPTGWLMRNDDPKDSPANDNFTTMAPGMHVESGPAAIYWNPANTAAGSYTVSATLAVHSTPMHDAVGIIWGGSDLSEAKETYGYFLVYGDGSFTVKHRSGASTGGRNNPDVHTVIAKTPNAAIKAVAADGGSATNNLAVKVAADSVRFFVNDVEVGAADAKSPMMPSSGIYGFRVNHNISVHVSDWMKR